MCRSEGECDLSAEVQVGCRWHAAATAGPSVHIGGTLGVRSNVIWINHSGHGFAPQESMARGRERVLCRPVAVKRHRGCPGALRQGARVWAGANRQMASG